ncbi:MAG: geranylgeranylglycerol-phosphate geranylgeranyltransferase [Thermoplasmata archaeon]|uniref:Geranylgeranylglycerol-phosphate geranylgeranyltransferase n=1 Tax=Candidatus Sysuiplasma superficiale TaxID=2823368 RepID=A0A8J8CEF5_9ARCH|nr:geranylgeranylglycerol-phosphate geranylgeranyltransferase [Candidatus Sysuiplasma superficiale]MBX8643390.1 geranylgeranylglycerol-phosphate geranylgeranyltransferase [Candidatus Sysuiplasma superficiale]MCL4346774.1 geranylgeranylglycerol-phosphate geranylgeranyltransferase [Candidatus Thermoplasmatota archaeon]MCL5437435.1 geranylgeranylglycerol-phosphate geranylgeranyltransferase [Candidatus Thermoplasmatota archaeon]
MVRFSDFIRLIRYGNCAMSAVAALLGALVSRGPDVLLHPEAAGAAMAVVFLFTGAGNTINDYLDAEIDRKAHPERPIPSGTVERSEAKSFSVIMFSASLLISLFINLPAVGIVVLSLAVMLFYEFRLKKAGISGNLAIAWLTASLFLFGAVSVGSAAAVWALFVTSFMATLGREIIKDIQDVESDRGSRKTLPMSIGIGGSRIVASVSIAAAVAVSPFPFMLHQFSYPYLAVVAVADMMFIYSALQQYSSPARAQSSTKMAMYVALLAFLVGALGV